MRLLFLLLVISTSSFAQYIGVQEVDEKKLSPWIPKWEIQYAGAYHFGESEDESTLKLIFTGDCIIGQISSSFWDEKTNSFKSNYRNLSNILFDEEGNFTSDQYSGKFVRYLTTSGKYLKGLRVNNSWSSWIKEGQYEIGFKSSRKLEDLYYGEYGYTSYRKLDEVELNQVSSQELKIMRNEIFARYGYIFKEGGKMAAYFIKQDWYRPQHSKVNNFLTEIELYNIHQIKKAETSK